MHREINLATEGTRQREREREKKGAFRSERSIANDAANLKLTSRRSSGVEREARGNGTERARKPARNVIFRQMCGHEREIIAPEQGAAEVA